EKETPAMNRDARGQRVIHDTELPSSALDSPLHQEWEFYKREVGRLLAEGHEGRFVLIKCGEMIGLWETEDEARNEGARRYCALRQPYLVHQIQEWEPLLYSLR